MFRCLSYDCTKVNQHAKKTRALIQIICKINQKVKKVRVSHERLHQQDIGSRAKEWSKSSSRQVMLRQVKSCHNTARHLLWRRAKVSVMSKASDEARTEPEWNERTDAAVVAPQEFRPTRSEDDEHFCRRRWIAWTDDNDDATNLVFIMTVFLLLIVSA